MTKYIPVIKMDGEVQFIIYTAPAPTEGEWELLRAIIDNNADLICTEHGMDTPVKVSQAYKTERREAFLRWDIVLRFNETPASRMPSPFDEWITREELWNDYGQFVGNRDEMNAKLEEAYKITLWKMIGDYFNIIEKTITFSGLYPYQYIMRVKE